MDRLALSIVETTEASGLSRSKIYQALATGELRSLRVGSRRLILREDLEGWLRSLRDSVEARLP